MADVNLQIKIDSAPAQSGAAAIRAELDQLKSKYGEVIALQGMVAESVTNASAKIIAAAERKAAAETAAAAKIEAANIAAAAKVEAASVSANAKAAIAAENRAAKEAAALEKATAASRAHKSAVETEEQALARLRAVIDTTATASSNLATKVGALKPAWDAAAMAGSATLNSAKSLTEAMNAGVASSASAAAAHNTLNESTGKAGSGLTNMRHVVSAAGLQISDLAIVATMGGNNIAQAGIQIGQFLGILGAGGAVMGAAVTVGAVLAQTFLKTGSAADEAAKAQKSFNDALRDGENLLLSESRLLDVRADRMKEKALQTRTDEYGKLQEEIRDLERKRRENTAVTPTEDGMGDATILNAKEEKRLSGLISIKQSQLAELQGQIDQLLNQNPRAKQIARDTLSSGSAKENLEGQRDALQAGIDEAIANKDSAALARLTEAYGAVNRAIATYKTDGEKAVLLAEAQAKAATMGEVEGRKYLAVRQAEIGMMGKAVEQGEREKTLSAARIEATASETKTYVDAQKAISVAAVESRSKVALSGLDSEREAISLRRNLLEISAADEIAQLREVDDRKRAIEMEAAQEKVAVLRRTHPEQYATIDAAERAITELRAKHALDRQKQLSDEVAARTKAARDMAALELSAQGAAANDNLNAKAATVAFDKSMGRIDGTEELAALRAIADEKYQIEVDLLEKKKALGGLEENERKRIDDQIVALDRKRAADMTALDRQAASERMAQVNAWTAPFSQAMGTMVSGFAAGTNSMQRMVARFGQSVVLSYGNMAAQAGMKWFNQHVVMAAWDRAFATQEVATAAAKEGTKARLVAGGQASQTAATRAGSTARAASGATEDAGFFSRIGTQVSAWLGLEGAKTAATVTNEGVRTGVTATGAITREAVETAETASSVGKSAARGAAGTYADAAENIPYGWLIGAGLAAATFAAIMAFSAEGGWGEVPYDGAPTVLHKQEMVLPAKFAVPLREMLTSGKMAGSAADNIATPNVLMAGAGMSAPAILARPPSGASQNTTNNNSQSVAPVVNVQFTHNGGGNLTKEQIMQHSVTIAKAVAKEVRHFNKSAQPHKVI